MKDFRELKVWQKAHRLVLEVYRFSKGYPSDERFGLTNQIRRAAVSISSNISEGCGRDGDAELARFLQIAMGSACEVEYQLLLSRDLGYLDCESHDHLNDSIVEVKRMFAGFLRRLRQK